MTGVTPALCTRVIKVAPVTTAAGLSVIAVLVHLFLRPIHWTHEWDLAIWQYTFVVILLGPLALGLAALEAAQFSRGVRDAAGLAEREPLAVVAAVAPVVLAVLAVAVAGLVGVSITVATQIGLAGFAMADLLPAVAMISGVLGLAVLGAVMAWQMPRWWVAPLGAIAVFVIFAIAYGTRLSLLVDFGGASGSLVGLQVNPWRAVVQTTLYTILGSALLLAVHARLAWGTRRRRLRAVSLGLAGSVFVVPLVVDLPRVEADLSDPVVCAEDSAKAVEVCVGAGYASQLQDVVAAVAAPAVQLVALVPGHGPITFDQRVGVEGAAVISPSIVQGAASDAAEVVVASLVPQSCDIGTDETLVNAYAYLSWWLAGDDASREDIVPDELVPRVALSGSDQEQLTWATATAAQLASCSAS